MHIHSKYAPSCSSCQITASVLPATDVSDWSLPMDYNKSASSYLSVRVLYPKGKSKMAVNIWVLMNYGNIAKSANGQCATYRIPSCNVVLSQICQKILIQLNVLHQSLHRAIVLGACWLHTEISARANKKWKTRNTEKKSSFQINVRHFFIVLMFCSSVYLNFLISQYKSRTGF